MHGLSYQEAITIQRSQLEWYRSFIGLQGVRKIRKATKPCPSGIHPEEPVSILTINRLVPRGGDIENLIRRWRSCPDSDDIRLAVARGIRAGQL